MPGRCSTNGAGGAISHPCVVCGEEKLARQVWFLLTENDCQESVRVLQWEDRLTSLSNMYCACSPAHVRELIAHWMTMGTLDYPFADSGSRRVGFRRPLSSFGTFDESCRNDGYALAELTVHRESLERILDENPGPLRIILEELVNELQREANGEAGRLEAPRLLARWSREV